MKALIIDHQANQIKQFQTELTNANFDVYVANTGREGLQQAATILPDVILLGEMLPNMTGNDALKLLKENEATKKIPVIILSDFKTSELIAKAMELGAADYIAKESLSATDLVEKVKAIIQQQHGGTGWQQGDANAL